MRIWIRHCEQILYLDSSKMMRGFLGSGSTTLQNSTVLYVSLQIGCNLIRKRPSEQFFTLCNYSKVLVNWLNSHRKKHRTVHSMSNLNKKQRRTCTLHNADLRGFCIQSWPQQIGDCYKFSSSKRHSNNRINTNCIICEHKIVGLVG